MAVATGRKDTNKSGSGLSEIMESGGNSFETNKLGTGSGFEGVSWMKR